jgi:membrane-associated PAP2 superfamily phosphatase
VGAAVTTRFWTTHAGLPAAFFTLAFAGIALGHVDFRLATAAFYDAAARAWLGAHTWWAEDLIHEDGLALVRSIAAIAMLAYAASWVSPRLAGLRRDAGFVALAIVLGTGIVALLKQLTNVDCPWSLTGFGGTHAYVALLGHRPPGADRVACFPGAHSSGGFALMCFYFILRDRQALAARVLLVLGIVMGAVFAFGQEARGAHFLSHDLASAAIVWFTQLALYLRMLAPTKAVSPPAERLLESSACRIARCSSPKRYTTTR